MNKCTIFENIYSPDPIYITVEKALERIKSGKSKARIEEIRNALDKEKADALKRGLPSVCFSGVFTKRTDDCLTEHSGYLVLDFDNVDDLGTKIADISEKRYVHAIWVSPRGNGVKALVKIADGKKHRLHFQALKEIFPDADASGVNESRVCYESYDPHMWINPNPETFTRTTEVTKIQATQVLEDEGKIFSKLLKWLTNKGGAFVKGERNIFIYKLASACCRFGIWENSAVGLILSEYPASNDFSQKECVNTIKSAYRSNKHKAGDAVFEKEVLVDKVSRKEVEVEKAEIDENTVLQDVIYSAQVKENAFRIHKHGYESVAGIGVQKLDEHFKPKRGEITCLTGIGNYGKSTFYKWYMLMRVLLYGEKFASFAPEDNPPEEYYHDFVEMLLGCNCTPHNPDGTVNFSNPQDEYYSNAYDFIGKHIFYLFPKDAAPTPEYIKERFLELVIKEKVDGVCIDPFNQLAHSYGGKKDEYLEGIFADFHRFAQVNNTYMMMIAHPNKMQKQSDGNYPCPDVFDMAGGAMWNNKMDNILVYHKPRGQTEPSSRVCEFHSKKIRRQKTVGKKGWFDFEYNRKTRRFEIDGHDPLGEILRKQDLSFNKRIDIYQAPGLQKAAEKPTNFYAGFQQRTIDIPNDFWNNA